MEKLLKPPALGITASEARDLVRKKAEQDNDIADFVLRFNEIIRNEATAGRTHAIVPMKELSSTQRAAVCKYYRSKGFVVDGDFIEWRFESAA